jgi:hypothetical protein
LEKDYYVPRMPNLGVIERSDYLFDDLNKMNRQN